MGNVFTPGAEEPTPPTMSFLARLVGVFVSPGPAFADIARRPGFIAPLLVVVLLSAAGTEAFLAKIGIGPILRWALEHSSRASSMSPTQIQQIVDRMVPIQTIVTHIMGVLWVPLLTLLVAVIGLVILNSIFGTRISFKLAFSIPAYAYLVNVIYILISIVLVFFGDPDHFISNPQNPTPTSLGFFLNPVDTSRPLMAFGGSLEIFTFWYMVLLGIGFSEASQRKVKFTPIFLIYLGLWLVVALIKTGIATLG